MIREILIYPDKRLRGKAEAIDFAKENSKQLKRLVADLKETMLAKDGLGLAAPQINVKKRIVVINTKDGAIALINPKITDGSWLKKIDEEGCLSVPGVYGKVKRHHKIKLTAISEDGECIEIDAPGLLARVIQHEVDHLDGILFIDKVVPDKKNNKKM